MSNYYPSDWHFVKLGDVATISASSVDKRTRAGQRPVHLCNYMDVFQNSAITTNLAFMESTASEKEIRDFSLFKGDVLLTKDSEVPEEIGIPSVVRDNITDLLCGYHLYILRPEKSQIDSEYFCWWLRSAFVRKYFYQMANGSTRFGLNAKHIEECPIILPPLLEQKKIAEILSGIDSLSSRLQELKKKKKNLFSALLIDIFDRLTPCATPTRIGDICEVKRGASPRPIQDKRWWGNGRGWTRISDVTNAGKYLFSTKDKLSQEGEEKSVPINPGEIILSICATIGLPIIVRTPVCIHDGFVWFDGISITASSEYMYYYFLSIRKHLLSGRQTGTQGNLNTSIVADQVIPIPSRKTQDKIVDMMSNIEDQIKALETKILSVSILKSAIAADLLSGRKRVGI